MPLDNVDTVGLPQRSPNVTVCDFSTNYWPTADVGTLAVGPDRGFQSAGVLWTKRKLVAVGREAGPDPIGEPCQLSPIIK